MSLILKRLVSYFNNKVHYYLFSATYPPSSQKFIEEFI